jgi:hypothetical protein
MEPAFTVERVELAREALGNCVIVRDQTFDAD